MRAAVSASCLVGARLEMIAMKVEVTIFFLHFYSEDLKVSPDTFSLVLRVPAFPPSSQTLENRPSACGRRLTLGPVLPPTQAFPALGCPAAGRS